MTTKTSSWGPLHYIRSTDSTQRLAKEGAVAGKPEGSVWVAESQTAGRGRLDRVWASPKGGLWMSLLLRPDLPPAKVTSLSLLAGLSLVRAIEKTTKIKAKLKWPNDVVVLVNGRYVKLAGILTEMWGELDRTKWVVLGLGLNVNNPIPSALKKKATSLRTLYGKAVPPDSLRETFLADFKKAYEVFGRRGFDAFKTAYWAWYSCPDEIVNLKTASGKIKGTARGVDGSGALLIESRGQLSPVIEGEITL